MSADVLRVTSIRLQGLDEPLAMGLPDGLWLQRLDLSSPLNHQQTLDLTFMAETVDPIRLALQQMLVDAVMTIDVGELSCRGRITQCTADHLTPRPPSLIGDGIFDHDDLPTLYVTVTIIGSILRRP